MTRFSAAELAEIMAANPDIGPVCPPDPPSPNAARVAGQSEHEMQVQLFAVIERRAVGDPRYSLIAALPNGQYRRGQRMEPGLQSGLPDIGIFWPRPATDGCPAYHGAFLELKREGGRVSEAQRTWMQRLTSAGYYAAICWGMQMTLDTLDWYLD